MGKKLKDVDLLKQKLQLMSHMPQAYMELNGLTQEEYDLEVAELQGKIEASNLGKMKRRKGSTYENKIAKKFKDQFGITLVRTPMSGGFQKDVESGDFKGDINCIEPNTDFLLHIECKNHAKWSVHQWWQQAIEDCPAGRIPLLAMHRGQVNEGGKRKVSSDDFVMLRMDDFLNMVQPEKIIKKKKEVKQNDSMPRLTARKRLKRNDTGKRK